MADQPISSPTTPVDLDALERAARAAEAEADVWDWCGDKAATDTYLNAVHPSTILSLLSDLRALRAQVAGARALIVEIAEPTPPNAPGIPDDAYAHKAWRGFWHNQLQQQMAAARAWLAQTQPQAQQETK